MKKYIFIMLVAYFSLEVYAAFSPSQEAWLSVTDTEPAVGDTTGYLIVSTPKYREPIKKFMEWKRTLGFQVDTLLLNSNPLTNTQVLDSIQNRYNQNNHLAYLLIVGSSTDIPTFTESIYVTSGMFDTGPSYASGVKSIPSDYRYGIIVDSLDIPIIKRGRILVNSADEATVVFDKIRNYELSPVSEADFYRKGLNIAQYEHYTSGALNVYEKYRFVQTSERIRNLLLAEGKSVDRLYKDVFSGDQYCLHWNNTIYSNGKLVPDSVSYLLLHNSSVSAGDVKMIIDNGVFLVLYYDHGSNSGWSTTGFGNNDITNLNNGARLPLVVSCCCHSGDFSSGNCFAGNFVKKVGGGSIATIAATQIIHTGFSDAFLEGLFSSIWPDNGIYVDSLHQTALHPINYTNRQPIYRIGDILNSGLSAMKEQFDNVRIHGLNGYLCTVQETRNFLFYSTRIYHLFGDPSVELWTSQPQEIAPPEISVANDSVHIELSDGNARISFYNTDTGEVLAYYGSSAGFNCGGSKVRVCITRHNYLPLVIETGEDIYIQNEKLQGERIYKANNISVGKNVDQTKPNGEVLFKSGSKTMIKGGSVLLDKGTMIERGAQVFINN